MLTRFFDALDVAMAAIQPSSDVPPSPTAWSVELASICKQLVALGDDSAARLANIPKEDLAGQQAHLHFHLHWVDQAKSFLVLWRNSLLELSKSHFYAQRPAYRAAQSKWLTATLKRLQTSVTPLRAQAEQPLQELTEGKQSKEQLLKAWQQQDLPWPTYRKQLLTIAEQAEKIAEQHKTLARTSGYILELSNLVTGTISECLQDTEKLEQVAQRGLELLRQHWPDEANKLPVLLENLDHSIEQIDYNARLGPKLDRQLQRLAGNETYAIAANNSALQVKDINFRRYLSAWMDSRILPPLYEISELTTQLQGNLKMAIINVRNRIILLNTERATPQEQQTPLTDIQPPLKQFERQLNRQHKALLKLQEQITTRLQEEVQITAVFDPESSFLETRLPSTLARLRDNQSAWLNTLPNWITEQRQRFSNWINDVRKEDALSVSEKVVRYIERQQPDPNNQSYTSIFLTHGYIGDSFWVGREEELERVRSIVRQWQQGFRGAILLTGNRFCGKTLLGDLISNEHFSQNTLRLSPNSTLTYQGRHFTTDYDLGAALQFVSKYTNDNRPLIWIDDLERWHDPKQTIGENVTSLEQHINRYANRIFYLISLGHPLRQLLNKSHQLEAHFQATLALDTMSQEAISQAILIRHGATHKVLVNEDGEKTNAEDFNKLIRQIYFSAEANIGEALNHWAYSTTARNIDEVKQRNDPFNALPDFLTADHALLLKAILLERRTNEYRLRKRFGPAFQERFAPILQRLLSVGVVQRQLDNWLIINNAAVNDVIFLLRNKNYF